MCHEQCAWLFATRGVLFLRASIAIGIGRYAIGTENDVRRTKFVGTLGTFREKSRDARQLSGEDHAYLPNIVDGLKRSAVTKTILSYFVF